MSDNKNSSNFLSLKFSKKDFLEYKEELSKFFSIKKDEYKNLFESFDILKQKKLHLSYLFFSYYNSWIFPYISYNKITRGNIFSSTFEISFTFKKLSKNPNCPFDEKLFILWFFYIYYNFFIKEKKQNSKALINQNRYILLETGKVVINLFEQKLHSLQNVLNILDINLLCFEFFCANNEFQQFTAKIQKLRKLIFFLHFFHLLEKISIIIMKQNENFEKILDYLDKIKSNIEINDEMNIILLFKNNILQNFIRNLLDNMNIVELEKTIPNLKNRLADFYAHFLKNKYKISKTFNLLQDTLRHSFEHLYSFKQNKNLIIRDIFKINFNSAILNKLFKNIDKSNIENIEGLAQLNSSFFFDSTQSGLIFKNGGKLQLEQIIIFFSFRCGNINVDENKEIPLLLIMGKDAKNKETNAVLKIFLKISEKEKFKLYISQQKDSKDKNMKVLNEDSDIIINKNKIYYCAFYLFGKKVKIFIHDATKNFPEIYKKEITFNPIKEDKFSFCLGKDKKNINFHKGSIGPFIMIRAPKINNLDKLIEEILSLNEKYPDFLIIKSDLSKTYDLKLKDYFGNEYLEESIKTEKIKGTFDCLLYLSPEIINFFKNKIIDEQFNIIPDIYDNPSHWVFSISNMDITILNEENFIKSFLADNGINYFCLLFEYFAQLFRYYLLKKDNEKIFEENEIKIVLNHSFESIKSNLLMSWKNNYSKYLYKHSKTILSSLYNCLLNMNKIEPIISEIYQQLLLLKSVNKSVLMNCMNEYIKDKNDLISYDSINKKDLEKINKNKFIEFNISLFIGIIEILLTPEFYNMENSKINIIIIEKIFESVINEIKVTINMIDISLIDNIFYKFLSFIELIIEHFSKKENGVKNEILIIVKNENKNKKGNDKYKKLIKNIFGTIVEILNSKYDENKILVQNYFHKLFLFVFVMHINNYDLVLNYFEAIDNATLKLMFDEQEIIELKNILFKIEKHNEKKEDDDDKDNKNINDEKIQSIQGYIINKIYEFIFLYKNEICPIKINFLEEFFKTKKISKYIFIRIQNLLINYLVNIFQDDICLISALFNMNFSQINNYFKKIFEFLRFFLKYLNSEDLIKEKEMLLYLDFIYDLMYESPSRIKIKENNFRSCTLFLLNYIEFIYISLIDDEKHNYLYHKPKVVKIVEELFDKCVESTLIHCDFYLTINEGKNLTFLTSEKKLVSEIFFYFYIKLFEDIYNIYRNPEKNKDEINKNDITFVKSLNSFFGKKLISVFNLETYDVKNLPYIQKFKSIFFLSDFYHLSLYNQKYYKKYSKNKSYKNYIQEMKFYNSMQTIILKVKPDFIDFTSKFEYFHTTYYFYQLQELYNIKILSFINDEELKKNAELKNSLEEVKLSFVSLKNIIINDHFKLNLICKDYYDTKHNTNDNDLKNMLKSIKIIIFDKNLKNNEKLDLVNKIEAEFKTNEIKSRKSTNSRGSSDSNGSNPQKKFSNSFGSKDSFDGGLAINDFIIFPEINNESNNINIINEDISLNKNEIIVNDSFNEKIKLLKESMQNSHTKNILKKLDRYSVINPKKEFMKKIFGIYFSESFFENTTFKTLKNIYLNKFKLSDSNTKLLNYPSKVKHFSNGLEPPNFLKDNNKFFISKIFTITHKYFYDYMCEKNLSNDSIILLKSNLLNLENIDKTDLNIYNCELIRTDKAYYGQLINSLKERLLLFSRQTYESFDINKNSNAIIGELKERGFSLSTLKFIDTANYKKAKEKAKNIFLDEHIYPNEEFNFDKKVLIFYDDIEEIVDRRILYRWQGFEIFLKNGKSYIFNMVNKTNYEQIINSLKAIPNVLFRQKDFLNNKQEISLQWMDKKLDTYEYLLYINKYSSRSYNDINQYYILPWIILDFSKIDDINKNEKEIFRFIKTRKLNESNKKLEREILELIPKFRNFRYPVSAQIEKQRLIKIEKFNDEEENFKFHHGTHYSTSSYVEYYLMRNEPYTTLIIELQNYSNEDPNRLLLRLKDTIYIINSGYDNRELIPEIFSKIDIFINVNCGYFGNRKDGELIDDVKLILENNSFKEYNNLEFNTQFILAHKKLLNSDTIALNINKWIDNVFGVMQYPPPKKMEKSLNLFPKSTYEKFNDLENKLERLSKKYEGKSEKILKKFINKINVITSFGQCPHKIFTEEHKNRELINANSEKSEESNNYGLKDDYLGTDFIETYSLEQLKNDNTDLKMNYLGIYFETNPQLEKVFILSDTNKLTIVDTNFYNLSNPTKYNWTSINDIIKLPQICLFNKIIVSKDKFFSKYFYTHNLKYAFSSFPPDDIKPPFYLYANENINNTHNISETPIDKFKIITCRHIDNSFKLHFISLNLKKKKLKEIETYSHICEDFVMCCKALSNNTFIIGLRNGKLIKAAIHEFNNNNDIKNNKKQSGQKYDITFNQYIMGHMGSINVLEIDERLGIVITAGDDNKIFIRKLIDFELLTCIKFKSKFIITMAKVSQNNLLYVICYNRCKNKTIIFGYSLSGLKFAKSDYSFFTNIEFTSSGNIISLESQSKLKILYGYNLHEIKIDKKDSEYNKISQIFLSFNGNDKIGWIQFNDFKKYYGIDRSVISFTRDLVEEDNIYQTLKVTNISYFE